MNTRSTTRSGYNTRSTRSAIIRPGRGSRRNSELNVQRRTEELASVGTNLQDNVDVTTLSYSQRRSMKARQLIATERKLVRSCEHVILLNDKIRGLTKRYKAAREAGFKSFRYNLRIRLAAVEGVRNMYYEYARDRAEEVAELRKELYNQNVEIVTGAVSDGDASDEEEDDDVDDMEIDEDDDEEIADD
ncbi:hypothetical protein ACF0H5_018786 [Mactra antiquata]